LQEVFQRRAHDVAGVVRQRRGRNDADEFQQLIGPVARREEAGLGGCVELSPVHDQRSGGR
jgi:hypothetical protein